MVKKMNTFYDVQQLLKSFGHIVYFGDREAEIDFMKDELKEMYLSNVIERELWQKAASVLQQESERVKRQVK
ncbi:YqgQ family protein [Bacillus nakamurai]|uniref:YqgQ family protein n=1 Tax=Bacillus nakamurai TaxID=1793963 RepID=UPI001E63BA9D|nr:YqgQ family protein [Bacillus nakamurai]MCC9023143.1 YqgQ family protein [Bacillus nakamurai]MCP6681045.1 YqgQ family protein [Bacillus nakamurai]